VNIQLIPQPKKVMSKDIPREEAAASTLAHAGSAPTYLKMNMKLVACAALAGLTGNQVRQPAPADLNRGGASTIIAPMRRIRAALAVLALGWTSMGSMLSARSRRAGRGPRDLSDGVIKSVTCYGKRLQMRLQTQHQLLRLYTADYFKVDFSAANFKPKHTINPCEEIRGMRAQAIFYDVPGRPNDGVLISVELKRPKRARRK
jgi:hypothetical protein